MNKEHQGGQSFIHKKRFLRRAPSLYGLFVSTKENNILN